MRVIDAKATVGDDEMNEHHARTKVLVIDDETPIRLLCRVNLEAEGMEVVEAADGPSGLREAHDEKPDIVLLNVMMPGLDGWRVAEELLEDDETSEIPIVFLTARRTKHDRLRGLELGAVDYITKPFNPLELAPRIRDLLERIACGKREELRREKLAEVRALMTEKDLPLSVFFAVQRLHPKKRRGFWRRWPKELEGYSKDRVSGIELRAAGWPSPEAEESEESDVRVLRDREGRIVAIDLTGDRWLTHEEYVAHIWWAAQEAERSRKEEETRKRYLAVRLAKQTANLAPDALPNLGKKKLAVFIMRLQETVDQIARADPEQAENSAEQLREAVAAIEAARVELASREDKGGVARRQAKTITMRKTTLVATIAGAFFLWLSATQAGKVELGRLVFHPVEVIPAYFSRCGDYEPDLASFESDAGRNYTQQDLRAFNRSVYKCRKNASVTGRWKTRTWVNLVGWLSLLTAAGALVVGGKELQTRVSRTKSRSPGHSVGRL